MHPTVLVASPVRNRAWVLPDFLGALERLEYPAERLSYHFLVNDCVDESPALLHAWASAHPQVTVEELNTGVPGWNRQRWPHYNYDNLALLRNRLLDRFLASDASYLFSVDSDIIVPPSALDALVAADKPVISGVIANLPGLAVEVSPIHNFLFREAKGYRHVSTVPAGVFEVDLTGAVYLIRRDVIAAGVRYEGRRTGEDVGFCEQAKSKGFQLWCHGDVRCDHRMLEPPQQGPTGRLRLRLPPPL